MASVTFLASVGGDNSTVTDDSSATTGLANGGHRLRFVPSLAQIVAIASNVVSQAVAAAASASTASTQASNASTSATNANNSFLSFDKRYLGSKTGDPTLDNQGAALLTGAIYWNSSTNLHRVWSGSAWSNVVASSGAFADNNFIISDDVDSTKKVNFQVSGVGTGTTITLTVPNASGTLLTSASGMATLASPTFTGTVTTPTITTTGATALSLTNATSNLIAFNTAGVAAPTFTTRSAGTKIVIYPNIAATTVDFALGIESATMWTSVPTTSHNFKWYGGTTLAATLTGAGDLSLSGAIASIKTDIGAISASEVLVGYAGDNIIKKQSLANFAAQLDISQVVNQPATNTTMAPGKIYQHYAGGGAATLIMPARLSSVVGATIVIECMRYPATANVGWDTYNLTISVPADVSIGVFGAGVPIIVDMPKLDRITLRCEWVDAVYATWSIGLGG